MNQTVTDIHPYEAILEAAHTKFDYLYDKDKGGTLRPPKEMYEYCIKRGFEPILIRDDFLILGKPRTFIFDFHVYYGGSAWGFAARWWELIEVIHERYPKIKMMRSTMNHKKIDLLIGRHYKGKFTRAHNEVMIDIT